MIHNRIDQPHIVFIYSNTGGGHRSAAEAIIEALKLEFPHLMTSEMVDFFCQYAPPPFNLAVETYPSLSRMPDIWRMSYQMSNGRRRMRYFNKAIWPYVRRSVNRLVNKHPCSLIVSVHPLVNAPILRALRNHDVPFVTVVTDLVSTHAAWYHNKANLVIVPTEAARERAIQVGIQPDHVKVIGLPVSDRFCQLDGNREELRIRFGWPQDLPIILLVGGGEGMGPLEKVAHAINQANFQAALVVVAGRNRKLKSRLERDTWRLPTFIYGFVHEMPDFMCAADILVTKAGPGTISEAFIAGLPMILYSRMPGQEDGNVTYVVKEGAGIWAPVPERVVSTLKIWLDHPGQREQASKECKRLARPQAAREIARALAFYAAVKTQGQSV